jgi:glucosyl-3-phosphoglycerate synthase
VSSRPRADGHPVAGTHRKGDSLDTVDDWFARNTYRARELSVEELGARKRESGLRVSVVVPARNEAETIGGVLAAIGQLSGTLVDELVVMDGGSDDGTPDIAARAGAAVHDDGSVLSDYGPPLGKGDALWRSLTVTSGDVVVFVDADIHNPSPQFVYGLLAPLLADPGVQLVKAFYDRPIRESGQLQRGGGGRVTELMARPLLNLFWPPLAGLVQPLSGEYAGRRALLEAIPFFTGYGVELGMLVDTLERVGADAIAQVDVGERIHNNQPIDALSRMAFAIAQVAMARLEAADRVTCRDMLPTEYLQFTRDDHGRVVPDRRQVEVVERPPRSAG